MVEQRTLCLYIPTVGGKPTESATEIVNLVEAMGLGDLVASCYQSVSVNVEDTQMLFGSVETEPYLEQLVGGEMACALYFNGVELQNELERLREERQVSRPSRLAVASR